MLNSSAVRPALWRTAEQLSWITNNNTAVFRGVFNNVDNFCKNPTVRIVCSALADSLSHNCVLMILYVNFLPLDMVVMFLAFMLEFYCMLMTCRWSHLHAYVECCGRYLASPRYITPSLLITRYFSDTDIPRIPRFDRPGYTVAVPTVVQPNKNTRAHSIHEPLDV